MALGTVSITLAPGASRVIDNPTDGYTANAPVKFVHEGGLQIQVKSGASPNYRTIYGKHGDGSGRLEMVGASFQLTSLQDPGRLPLPKSTNITMVEL